MNGELPRVRLRALEPEDLDILYRIENDMSLWDVGNTNVPYSRYALHDYIAHASHDIYADNQVRLMVENADGQAVGIVDLVNFSPRHLHAELGIVIERACRGKGYARAALRQAVDYSRSILHLHQLYVIVDCHNVIARQLFLEEGFTSGIQLKDWLSDMKNYHDAVLMQLFL